MHIKQIYIKNLWQKGNILWELKDDVNILVGINGSGKSTLLNLVYEALQPEISDEAKKRYFSLVAELTVHFSDDTFVTVDSSGERFPTKVDKLGFDIFKISTFDIAGSLDGLISDLYPKFEHYQKNLYKKLEESIKNINKNNIDEKDLAGIFSRRIQFNMIINGLFKETGKEFSEDNFTFRIDKQEYELTHQQLSSGEKQIFYILLHVLIQDGRPCILLLDEPEISLHIEWQRDLIQHIRELNPNCQLVAATHSASMFFGGWLDSKKNIEEIRRARLNGQLRMDVPEKLTVFGQEFKKINQVKNRLNDINAMIHRTFYMLTFRECKQILKSMENEKVFPDHFTYTTLISKTSNQNDAMALLEEMKKKKISPNGVTYVNILKKAEDFENAMTVFDKMREDKIEPAIQHFSVLLGKAESTEVVERVEELRALYGIPTNDIYANKLRLKK